MKKFFLKNILTPVALLFALASFSIAFANSSEVCAPLVQKINTMQVEWPQAPLGGYKLAPDSNLAQLVGYFFGWGVGLGGLAVFISLIIAGVQYITSVADPGKIKEAKSRIQSSLIGLVLLLSSWAIFQLINPNLTNLNALPKVLSEEGSLALLNKECTTSQADCCKIPDPNCNPQELADPSCDPAKTTCARVECPQVINPSCNPKYWECCQVNDKLCIAKGGPAVLVDIDGKCDNPFACKSKKCDIPSGMLAGKCVEGSGNPGDHCTFDGECKSAHCNPAKSECANQFTEGTVCVTDSDCQSNRCECNNGVDKDTSGEPVWQKKCARNPSICIMTFDRPELGCDIVRFYEKPDFDGKFADFVAWDDDISSFPASGDGQVTGKINDAWVFFPKEATAAFTPMSYQAFTYQRDSSKNIVKDSNKNKILIPCGESACGCMINRCVTKNSNGDGCIAETADPNTNSFAEFAYSTRTQVLGVEIRDSTKENGWQKTLDLGGQIYGGLKGGYCAIFGCN